jgi:flavin-dependent thymidylate synthase
MSFDQIQVELLDYMGSDRAIAHKAWTSSLKGECKDLRSMADVIRIVNMLAESGHAVPFEAVTFSFWIRMPIATDRQHMTHRIASHSGMSGRYRTMPTDFQEMPEEIIDIFSRSYPNTPKEDIATQYRSMCEESNSFYRWEVDGAKDAWKSGKITNDEFKRAREFIRGVLPQNNMTERVTEMNLRSFANYVRLRYSTHAGAEIRDVATKMLMQVREKCKDVYTAFGALERNEWNILPKYSPPGERLFGDVWSESTLQMEQSCH